MENNIGIPQTRVIEVDPTYGTTMSGSMYGNAIAGSVYSNIEGGY